MIMSRKPTHVLINDEQWKIWKFEVKEGKFILETEHHLYNHHDLSQCVLTPVGFRSVFGDLLQFQVVKVQNFNAFGDLIP